MPTLFNTKNNVIALLICVATLSSATSFARLATGIAARAAQARQTKIARLVEEGARHARQEEGARHARQEHNNLPSEALRLVESQQLIEQLVRAKAQPEKVHIATDFLYRIRDVTGTSEFESLLAAGNIQEIIWQLRDKNLFDQAEQVETLVIDTLKNQKIVVDEPTDSGVNHARQVTFANGLRAIVKPWHQARAVGLSRLDRLIGTNIFPLTVLRTIDGDVHSVQLLIEHALTHSEIGIIILKLQEEEKLSEADATLYLHNLYRELLFAEARKRICTLDLLSCYGDSGIHNFMTPSVGRTFLIDGGEAFMKYKRIASQKAYYDGYDYDQLSWMSFSLNLSERILRDVGSGEEYRTDADFIARLASITTEDLENVFAPLHQLFKAEEIDIFAQLDRYELPVQHSGKPQLKTRMLRAFWQDRGIDIKKDKDIIEELEIKYHLYRDLLSAPQHIRGVIADYVDAAKVLATLE